MICHSGVGLTPVIDGKVHHFSAGGLYNGLVLLIDDETRTYWDHMTGEAVHGPLKGATLDWWSIELTTVEAALAKEADLRVFRAQPSFLARVADKLVGKRLRGKGILPPGFRGTMGKKDGRLPEMTRGLGVVQGGEVRFYPVDALDGGVEDDWSGRALRVKLGAVDRVPFAEWIDDSTRPTQLFTRWYGFAYSYPSVRVHGQAD